MVWISTATEVAENDERVRCLFEEGPDNVQIRDIHVPVRGAQEISAMLFI